MKLTTLGKQRVKDHTKPPLQALQTLTTITPGQAVAQMGWSPTVPIGNYKGALAFLDLDKLGNQPLVWAEQLHILGILDGREEDYDLQTLAVAAAEAIGTVHTGALTVPAGEVWYINAVVLTLPASGGANIVTGNWRCSLWTDRVAAAVAGQTFHPADVTFGVGGGVQTDEFGVIQVLFNINNKPAVLRAPAGTIFTATVTNTVAVAAAAVNATLQLHGFKGKALVA